MEKKSFVSEVKAYNEADLTVEHMISTEKRDRGGDILRADGMKVNGRVVVLQSHGMGLMGNEPIAKPIWIRKGDFKGSKGIMAKTQFFADETGRRLWKKVVEGFAPNFSVGFLPIKFDYFRDDLGGRDVSEWELLEYSLVGVPMQPDAQALAFKIMPETSFDAGKDIRNKVNIEIVKMEIREMVKARIAEEIKRFKR